MDLEAKLTLMPSQPGVYLMKNGAGTILYVGKAKNLRSRVRSYFRKSGDGRFRIQFLIPNVEDIEFLVTDTEKKHSSSRIRSSRRTSRASTSISATTNPMSICGSIRATNSRA